VASARTTVGESGLLTPLPGSHFGLQNAIQNLSWKKYRKISKNIGKNMDFECQNPSKTYQKCLQKRGPKKHRFCLRFFAICFHVRDLRNPENINFP